VQVDVEVFAAGPEALGLRAARARRGVGPRHVGRLVWGVGVVHGGRFVLLDVVC
jgi:hypothetical protein